MGIRRRSSSKGSGGNSQNALTVLMAYYSAKAYYMNPIMELPSGKGFADVVYLPKRNVERQHCWWN